MTNEEIAARAIADAETPVGGGYMHDGHLDGLTCEALAAGVVAALTEAGRLVPDGLTLPKGEKVVGFCVEYGELQPFWPDHLNDET